MASRPSKAAVDVARALYEAGYRRIRVERGPFMIISEGMADSAAAGLIEAALQAAREERDAVWIEAHSRPLSLSPYRPPCFPLAPDGVPGCIEVNARFFAAHARQQEADRLRAPMLCGHPFACASTTDEGTGHCTACEREAKAVGAAHREDWAVSLSAIRDATHRQTLEQAAREVLAGWLGEEPAIRQEIAARVRALPREEAP